MRSMLGRSLAIAIAVAASSVSVQETRGELILQFQQVNPNTTPFALTNPTSSTSVFSSTGIAINIQTLFGQSVNINATLTFENVHNNGAATTTPLGGGLTEVSQLYTGSIVISNGSYSNILTANFTSGDGITLAITPGSSAQLSATEPPPGAVTFTSNYPGAPTFISPQSMTLSFSGVNPPITTTGTPKTIKAFTASGTGTFSDGSIPVNVVPEPSSMLIAGVGALGLIGYGLRRRKAVGA